MSVLGEVPPTLVASMVQAMPSALDSTTYDAPSTDAHSSTRLLAVSTVTFTVGATTGGALL